MPITPGTTPHGQGHDLLRDLYNKLETVNPTAAGQAVVWNGTQYVASDVGTQVEVDAVKNLAIALAVAL